MERRIVELENTMIMLTGQVGTLRAHIWSDQIEIRYLRRHLAGCFGVLAQGLSQHDDDLDDDTSSPETAGEFALICLRRFLARNFAVCREGLAVEEPARSRSRRRSRSRSRR